MFIKRTILFLSLISMSIGLSAQDWEQLSDAPFYKHHSNGFGYNGKAYIMEGINDNDIGSGSNGVWEYTPETDTWVQLADFPGTPRSIAIGDDWNGKYYYGFGFNGPNPLSDLWEFDPVDSSFTQLPSCPCEGRSHPALIAHNDKVYMGAGSGANNDLNDWWEYDMLTQVWTQKPNIPGGQRHHTFQFTIGDDIYVGGGHVFNWLKYSPDTEEWTAIDDLPDGRVAGSQFSHGKNGYLLGGDNYLHQHIPTAQTFMRYDAEMDDWEFLKSLPNGSRWAPSSFIINDILYYFGGESYFIPNDRTMWKFDLLSLDPPVSTDNIQDLENSIFAYPNPVQDKLNFGGEFNPDITYDLSLINTNGQTILREQKFNLNEELDVAALPQGIYIIQLKDEEATVQIKLLKTK